VWVAAARGRDGRRFAWGNEFGALRGNTAATKVGRTTPVGVFVEGETPEGVSDLTGNVEEWTGSLFGAGMEFEKAPFAYPYDPKDGREDPEAGPESRRVLRGCACSQPL
jgi:formylglycine-generating enzyme required for sulfatase activity